MQEHFPAAFGTFSRQREKGRKLPALLSRR
jgi:hypothetical protein